MNGKNLQRRIRGFVLTTSLVICVAVVSSTAVQARGFHGYRGGFYGGGFHTGVFIGPYPYWRRGPWYYGYPYGYSSRYVFSSDDSAENQGYRDGLKTGSHDARRGQSYDPDRSHYFRDAGFGNFAEAYRDGFARGYSDGFRS